MSKPKLPYDLDDLVDQCATFVDFCRDLWDIELDEPENLLEVYKLTQEINRLALQVLSDLFEYSEELLPK